MASTPIDAAQIAAHRSSAQPDNDPPMMKRVKPSALPSVALEYLVSDALPSNPKLVAQLLGYLRRESSDFSQCLQAWATSEAAIAEELLSQDLLRDVEVSDARTAELSCDADSGEEWQIAANDGARAVGEPEGEEEEAREEEGGGEGEGEEDQACSLASDLFVPPLQSLKLFSKHQMKIGYVPKNCVLCCKSLLESDTTADVVPGYVYTVVGLVSKPVLNGQDVIAVKFLPKHARWKVHAIVSGSALSIKPDNLRFKQAATAAKLPRVEDAEDVLSIPMRDAKLLPGTIVQCGHCAKNAFAFYCCEAHYEADYARHALAECRVMQRLNSRERRNCMREQVKLAPNEGDIFKVGFEEDKAFDVHTASQDSLQVSRLSFAAVEDETIPLPYDKSTANAFVNPIEDWLCRSSGPQVREDFDPGQSSADDASNCDNPPSDCDQSLEKENHSDCSCSSQRDVDDRTSSACCRPWVSFGSKSSVTLNWLPPNPPQNRFDRRYFRYRLYQCKVQEASVQASSGNDAVGRRCEYSQEGSGNTAVQHKNLCCWQLCRPRHQGHVYSHIVSELDFGAVYVFRVGVAVMNGNTEKAERAEVSDDVDTFVSLEPGLHPQDGVFILSEASDPFKIGFADFSPIHPLLAGGRDFTKAELEYFRGPNLDTPAKVQTFLDAIPMNQEIIDDVCLSPIDVVRQNHAHCIEGAMLGAFILSLHGHRPMLMDLRSSIEDDDHNITLFRQAERWGALSVTNHCVLRYMPPIFETPRQLAMAHVNEYMNGAGVHTLRSYSEPVHLAAAFGDEWHRARGDVFVISSSLSMVLYLEIR
eukprot:INCI17511.2.p1 GENE.INCI17511.2~~INCI17511.2.p1  ORF type:complete len:815 (-),score=115.56 INCI17511.2:472-2916(-)